MLSTLTASLAYPNSLKFAKFYKPVLNPVHVHPSKFLYLKLLVFKPPHFSFSLFLHALILHMIVVPICWSCTVVDVWYSLPVVPATTLVLPLVQFLKNWLKSQLVLSWPVTFWIVRFLFSEMMLLSSWVRVVRLLCLMLLFGQGCALCWYCQHSQLDSLPWDSMGCSHQCWSWSWSSFY